MSDPDTSDGLAESRSDAPHGEEAGPSDSQRRTPDGQRTLFISYSRADSAYAEQLAEHLRAADLPVWFDAHQRVGDQWPRRLADEIRRALCVIVLMSPASARSAMVEVEILEGQRRDRQFFPVLLSGEPHFLLQATQFFDARLGEMPGEPEIRQLRGLAEAAATNSPAPLLQIAGALHHRVRSFRPPPEVSVAKLRPLLAAKRIEHADIITTAILMSAAGRADRGWLRAADAHQIGSDLLDEIDALWSQASLGAFGFRAQLLLHGQGPAVAAEGGQQDFDQLALALNWKCPDQGPVPRYEKFVQAPSWPIGFFPTYRNPQVERLRFWYDLWTETAMGVHLRLREWGGPR